MGGSIVHRAVAALAVLVILGAISAPAGAQRRKADPSAAKKAKAPRGRKPHQSKSQSAAAATRPAASEPTSAPADGPFDEDNIQMPALDAWEQVRAESERLSGAKVDSARRDELYRREEELFKAMQAERDALNRRLFEARQAELGQHAPAETPTGRALGLDVLTYPRVNGSTSTHPLEVLIACRLLGADYEWTNKYERPTRWHGGDPGLLWPERDALAAEYWLLAKTDPVSAARLGAIINRQIAVHAGTHEGYDALTKRTADFALIARRPNEV